MSDFQSLRPRSAPDHAEFTPKRAAFRLVYPDRDTSAAAIQKHLKDYGYSIDALRDPDHSLVKLAGAKVTPEAVVFDRHRRIVYQGRIDDRYVDLGKERSGPTRRDLQEALSAVLAGKPVTVPRTRAIGCYIAE